MSFRLSFHPNQSASKAAKFNSSKFTTQQGRSVSKMGGLFVGMDSKLLASSSTLAIGALLLIGTQQEVSAVPINQPPVVASSTYTIPTWKDRKIINRPDRATDPESAPLSWSIRLQPSNGTLAIDSTDGLFLYTPTAGYTGGDTFKIGVSDGTNTTEVTYTIPIGAAPTSSQDVYTSLGASDNNAVGTSPYNINNGYTAQIFAKLSARYPGEWVWSNRGVNGFGAHDLVRTVGGSSVLDLLAEDQPEATSLWIGPNDVVRISLAAAQIADPTARQTYYMQQVGQFSSDLNAITDAIYDESWTGIVANVPQMQKLPAVIAQVNALIPAPGRQAALDQIQALSLLLSTSIEGEADQNDLPVVDLYNDSRITNAANIGTDGFHPSNAGYTILAEEFWNTKDRGLATERFGLRDLLNYEPETYNDIKFVARNSTNNVIDVLSNDFDYEDDTLKIVDIERLTPSNNGTLTITDGGTGLNYTPNAGFAGFEAYSYTISDGVYESNPALLYIVTEPPVSTSGALISEVRFRGPAGALDEYVEITNTLNTPINLSGWSIRYPAPSGTVIVTFPEHAMLPARGTVLYGGDDYSRSDYATLDGSLPAKNAANEDIDMQDGSGVALFNHLNARVDSVGYVGVAAGYREGTGLPAGGPEIGENREISLYRDLKSGFPKDTNNNAVDFIKVDPADTSNGGIKLGAPGPQDTLAQTQRNDRVAVTLFDPTKTAAEAPNRVRIGSGNAGDLIVRRKVTNNTGTTLYGLRFRIVDITAGKAPVGTADIRFTSSEDETVNGLSVKGTTLEQQSVHGTEGGAFNSSVAVDTAGGLAPGESIYVQFRFRIVRSGTFSFLMNSEGLIDP